MTEMGSGRTLGDLLASRRQRRFVGRASEIELLRVALDSAEPLFSALHVYGPAGIGKTRLLDVFAELAADAGASVVRLDGRDLVPSPPAVPEALGGVLEVPEGDGAIVGPSDGGRLVVLLDTYERLGPLDDWVRTGLLPRLPATALTVAAGRTPPESAWRADPAWRELLRVVSLRNLSPQESRRYLDACGVDPAAMTNWSSWPMATRWGCRCWPTWGRGGGTGPEHPRPGARRGTGPSPRPRRAVPRWWRS